MDKKSLFDRALNILPYYSRFWALRDDAGRDLTDEEVRDEAEYLLECLPFSNIYDELTPIEKARVTKQLKALVKN